MKKKCLLILLWGLIGMSNMYGQEKVISVTSVLNRMANIQDLPHYMEGTKIMQFSSYDTTGGNNDGFSGKYSFIRKTPDGSLVIFEAQGSGVINRIWTATPTSDTLDFYFDGAETPSFSIAFSDLFSSKVYPFVAPLSGHAIGGNYTYFPIPFEDGCKIVFRGEKLEFYQIQYRSFPESYEVKTFNHPLDASAKAALKKLNQSWQHVGELNPDRIIHTDAVLAPGDTLTLANITHGGRILGIELSPAKAFQGLHKQVDLQIIWDYEEQPAIYMPVADFFGYAFGQISMQSLLLGTKNNTNYSYFPMPFDKKATIKLIYRMPDDRSRADAIHIKAAIFLSNKERNANEEGKFYAYWNRNFDAPLGKPHLLLKGHGHGHYVGTILQAQGLNPGMTVFWEGDAIMRIDGEMRMHGTGSEDYFNGGWYALLNRWDRKMSLPLHGSLTYSLPYARTGGYRLFISDKIPFREKIHHTIEHGPVNSNMPVDYTSVAFYYADGPVARQQDIPSNANTDIYIPDTFMFYPQLMHFTFAGAFKIDGGTLQSASGGRVRIYLDELPKGEYKLYADVEKGSRGATIRIWQRQTPVSKSISFYADEKIEKSKMYLCDIVINDFKKTITLDFEKDSTRSKIHINRLILVQKQGSKDE